MAAVISAREQEKNCKQQAASEEKSRMQQQKSEITARIDSLCDRKRDMELRLTDPHIINNQNSIDRIECAMQGIDDEIVSKIEHLNSLLATPTRNNKSPKDDV